MGQIVRKKKGRPAKVDSGGRGTPSSEREPRRSNRRRSVKYMFELDDYFDELGLFEDEEDEDELKREKELKLLLKVESKGTGGGGQQESAGPKQGRPGRRVHHPASPSSSSFSSDVELPSKKRKMNEGIDYQNGDASYEDDRNDDRIEVRERKSELKAKIFAPGPQTRAAPLGLPLPDKKTLELILNIIQRKDIYGVFAEPVDPEELPDYHGVIKNPMDFGTVRNKLSNGLYTTLEQIESDVCLICSNAMQYNAPDTIYYKQARGMHELAKRKFYELSLNSRSSEKERKHEQNTTSSSILNRQVKSPVSQTMQDPAGFDFSHGAGLGPVVDIHHVSNALSAVGSSRPCSVDRLVERNSFLNDNNFEKGEALLPGNSSLCKPGRKLSAHEENRRATYDISLTHPLASSESIFSTFEGESKQLVPVGAYAEHYYARSLARFAAALGPVAWKISSKRIEQALPQEVNYGRGWVIEYEPLSTPVLMLENRTVMEPPFFSKKLPDDPRKVEKKIPSLTISSMEIQGTMTVSEKNPHSVGPAKIRPASAHVTFPMKAQPDGENVSEVKVSFFSAPCSKPSSSANLSRHDEKSGSKNAVESEKQGLKQVELNGPPIFNKNVVDFIGQGHNSKGSEVEVSRSIFTSRNVNFTSSGSVKQPDIKEVSVVGLSNGKVVGDRINSNTVACSSSNLAKEVGYYPQEQGQGLSDPVCLMRMLAEKAQNQQKWVYQSSTDAHRVLSPDPNRDNLNNTITAVSHALRSVGACGFRPIGENTNLFKNQHANFLNISTRDMHSQGLRFREESPASVIHYRPDRNNSPLNVFVSQGCPQPMRVGNNMHFQNQPMAFPPFPPNSKQMLDSLPPDLNVGFQSPGSPGKNPSSGGLVEPQQPDLALQL
ncbi:uncharacterized protein [Primulina eburnea]|uniref:uncharacterized protein isoform X1 n=1 Tax=Primulina eburnea TaxID=1245227 RepID=UPI003C6BF049